MLGTKEKANNRSYYTYSLKDADREKLLSMLTDTERVQIEKRLSNPEMPVMGYCYGMSVTSVLAYDGAFQPSDLVSGTKYLFDINQTNLNDDVRSAVNYYQLLQYTKAIEQKKRITSIAADKDKLRPLIDALEAGRPAVLGYTYEDVRGKENGHAVVAYGIEYQENIISRYNTAPFRYDTHILIYDNINGKHDLKNDLYINTSDQNWTWCIPKSDKTETKDGLGQIIMNSSEYKNGCISLVLTEPEWLNACGLFGGETVQSDMPDIDYEFACARYAPLNSLSAYGNYKTLERAADGSMNASSDKNRIHFSADLTEDSNEGGDEIKAIFDNVYGFSLSPSSGDAQEMSISMEYEHYLMNAQADKAKQIQFTPDAEIECEGVSGAYLLEMVIDKEARGMNWYQITVGGKDGGSLKMQYMPEEKGFLLNGNLQNGITVTAKADGGLTAAQTISTNYNSVMICEIDGQTIGFFADTDHDGKYETEILPDASPLRGDVTGDGSVSIEDAQIALNAYVDSVAGMQNTLTAQQIQAADVNDDGEVSAEDAQLILNYYVLNTISNEPTSWEKILGKS